MPPLGKLSSMLLETTAMMDCEIRFWSGDSKELAHLDGLARKFMSKSGQRRKIDLLGDLVDRQRWQVGECLEEPAQ